MDNNTAREEWTKAWPEETHTTEYAQKRIKSAKSAKSTPVMVDHENMFGYFQGSHGRYETFLDGCSCVDFARGKKPCKHIYRLAIELGAMEGAAESNPNMIPTPRAECVSLEETIDKIELLPEIVQRKILKIAGGIQPKQRFQYKRDGIEEVLRTGFVIDAEPQAHQIIWGRKDEIAEMLDSAGVSRPQKAKKDELIEIFAANILQKAEEVFDWWITVKISPEYSRRKIHYYLHRKLDHDLIFDPETGEAKEVPLLATDLPDDDVTGQLIKRGYYNKTAKPEAKAIIHIDISGILDSAVEETLSTEPPERNADGWEVWPSKKTGLPGTFYRSGKEWFDSDRAWSSPSGDFIIHEGMDRNGNPAIALTTKDKGIALKKTEDYIEAALATDDGRGYAISSEGNLFTLTAEKKAKKKLCSEYEPDAIFLMPGFCGVLYESDDYSRDTNEETEILKVVNLNTTKSWKKKIRYQSKGIRRLSWDIQVADGLIKITAPDQEVHSLPIEGENKKQ